MVKKKVQVDEMNRNSDSIPERVPRHTLESQTPIPIKKWSFANLRRSIMLKRKGGTCFLVNMELSNGWHESFIASHEGGSFLYNKVRYIIDDSCKYYHATTGFFALDYHESCTLPIKRTIDITAMKTTLEQSGISQIEHALNPSTLERFVTSKIAEGVMKGAEIDEYLRSLRTMILIIVIICAIHLGLFVIKSGMLSQIHIPGLK